MQVLKRLILLLSPYWKTIVISALLLVGRACLELVPPLIQREIIDEVITTRNLSYLGIIITVLIGAYALNQLVQVGDNYVRHSLGEKFIFDFRVRLYAYLQKMSLSFFERTSTGELMSRVTNDLSALESFVTHGSALTAVDCMRLIGGATILFVLDWRLAALVMIPVPILALAFRHYNTKIRPVDRQVRARLGNINAKLQDNLSGIRVIQAFAREDIEYKRFSKESERYYRARVKGIRYWSIFFPAIRFFGAMGTVIVLGVGSIMVVKDQMSLGTLVAFIAYIASIYDPINRLTEVDNIFQEAIAAGERIFELLDETMEVKDAPDAIGLPVIQGKLVFDQVHFKYGSGNPVLHSVSFTMAPGEVVALVGPSGAGKTSIANLICRFYDPVKGHVSVDGYNLRNIKLTSLRRQVAVVLQDSFLFNNTVAENLHYGKPDATKHELIAATRAANAHDFIMQLPDGYDTEVGERGVKLSGGQKQRLALARAILADPRILILDEATSSVDAEAEYLIQQALDRVLEGRTALVIAHRLSTIRNADKIIVLDRGRIAEGGNHQELMQRGGLYSQLYQRQMEISTE
ncbi:ABC transporter ATP-binding protein [Desulfosarcina sp.]|uniref:ABC transporter ATP-binding protein n=1 Tax=Desulfosarcina sp. TaxID=2027861 RepID=UPI0029B18F32|nr:ABC transporter ATP-binding protein [Desulfosarcina sp.]MDX2452239.1 ABC transporter ATP-binding protein [Desulfosarcina sp.]